MHHKEQKEEIVQRKMAVSSVFISGLVNSIVLYCAWKKRVNLRHLNPPTHPPILCDCT